MKNHKKIRPAERELLAMYLAEKKSKSECSRLLERPRKMIVKEIKRNSSWVTSKEGKRVQIYVAISAQVKANKRQLNSAHNKQELKNEDIYKYVIKYLRKGWSPEQIAGRLKLEHPGDKYWSISHETIYVWIYGQPKNEYKLYWYEYLRRKQKKRKKKKGRQVHKSHIPDRVSISERSEEANNRTEFGHWEGDSIEGKRKSNGVGLHTEVERMNRRIKAEKVKNLTSMNALKAQINIFKEEPNFAVKSTTLDNGKETHLHYKLRSKFNMDTFHAHPYSSFERGTNEHGNWHIRYYYPTGTDFSTVSNAELQEVIEEINDRPRKIHGYKTANEVYYQLVQNYQGCNDCF